MTQNSLTSFGCVCARLFSIEQCRFCFVAFKQCRFSFVAVFLLPPPDAWDDLFLFCSSNAKPQQLFSPPMQSPSTFCVGVGFQNNADSASWLSTQCRFSFASGKSNFRARILLQFPGVCAPFFNWGRCWLSKQCRFCFVAFKTMQIILRSFFFSFLPPMLGMTFFFAPPMRSPSNFSALQCKAPALCFSPSSPRCLG